MKDALLSLDERNFAEVARITLHYYDKAYDHSLSTKEQKPLSILSFETDDMDLIVDKLVKEGHRTL